MNSLSQMVAVIQPVDEESNYLPYAPNPEKLPTMEEVLSPTRRTLIRNKEANLFINGFKSFAAGRFDGWIIVVDRQTGGLVCRGKITVTSWKSVDYEYHHRGRSYGPTAAIRDDFVRQFEQEIAAVLPEGASVTMGKPHIPVAY